MTAMPRAASMSLAETNAAVSVGVWQASAREFYMEADGENWVRSVADGAGSVACGDGGILLLVALLAFAHWRRV